MFSPTTTRYLRNLCLAFLFGGAICLVGCEQKETLLDVETPDKELEIERDKNTGEISVDVDDQ